MQTSRMVNITGLDVPNSILAGRPSIWSHGAAMTDATWDSLRADLWTAIAPDLHGSGDESALPAPSVEG